MTNKAAIKNTKIDFSKSLKVIRNTSESVITQVRKSANDVADDVWKNGEQLTDVASQKVKKAIAGIDVKKGVKKIQDIAKEANDLTMEVAEELVDNSITVGEQWQKITAKAVRGGLKLAGKQQDLTFETMGMIKSQVIKGVKQIGKLRR